MTICSVDEGITRAIDLIHTLHRTPVLIGIAGGSCAGKTLIAQQIATRVDGTILPLDDYYVGIDHIPDNNFDHPSAMELTLLKHHLHLLKQGKPIHKPIYDFVTHKRVGYHLFTPSNVIITEGLYALHQMFRNILDIKIYVEAHTATRLARRLARDMSERGRTRESVLRQWYTTVLPMHKTYVIHQKPHADIIIINDGD